MIRKALGGLGLALLVALVATQWQDITRYLKIKQMSIGTGHPENVPAAGRTSYRQEAQPQTAQGAGRTAGQPQAAKGAGRIAGQ